MTNQLIQQHDLLSLKEFDPATLGQTNEKECEWGHKEQGACSGIQVARQQVLVSLLPQRQALPASNKAYLGSLGLACQEGWHEAHQMLAGGCMHVLQSVSRTSGKEWAFTKSEPKMYKNSYGGSPMRFFRSLGYLVFAGFMYASNCFLYMSPKEKSRDVMQTLLP